MTVVGADDSSPQAYRSDALSLFYNYYQINRVNPRNHSVPKRAP